MTDRARAIWALAAGQTLGYACLYYIFSGLVTFWQADLGWTKSALAVGPTCAIVLAGGLAPVTGRLVDRGWSRGLLTGGAGLGAMALVVLALSDSYRTYIAAWCLIGIAQAAVLYEVCFAVLIRRLGPDARAAIVRVTLVAGFASTLAFPVAAAMAERFDWRAAVWLAAAVVGCVQMPLNAYATTVLRRNELAEVPSPAPRASALRQALRRGRFWLLGGTLALLSLQHWMLIAFIVPLFTALGASLGTAVFAAALVGPAQVVGRLVLMRFDATAPNWTVLGLCLTSMGAGTLALLVAGVAPWMIFAFTGLQGAAIGVLTILRPVLIVDVLGREDYGAIAGSVQVLPLLAGAAAPLAGGLLFEAGGAAALIWASGATLVAATLGSIALRQA